MKYPIKIKMLPTRQLRYLFDKQMMVLLAQIRFELTSELMATYLVTYNQASTARSMSNAELQRLAGNYKPELERFIYRTMNDRVENLLGYWSSSCKSAIVPKIQQNLYDTFMGLVKLAVSSNNNILIKQKLITLKHAMKFNDNAELVEIDEDVFRGFISMCSRWNSSYFSGYTSVGSCTGRTLSPKATGAIDGRTDLFQMLLNALHIVMDVCVIEDAIDVTAEVENQVKQSPLTRNFNQTSATAALCMYPDKAYFVKPSTHANKFSDTLRFLLLQSMYTERIEDTSTVN